MSVATGTRPDRGSLEARIWRWLGEVNDPEIPVLSVVDLGIVRNVEAIDDAVCIDVAPTYSGCPATEVIEGLIRRAVEMHGVGPVTVRRVLSPPWTTDWISDEGRAKLKAYGIAPPESAGKRALLAGERAVACPRCGAEKTTLVSEFGSTACKASYRCDACLEPFEYFKCL